MTVFGTAGILEQVRRVFRGHELIPDATPEDFLFFVREFTESADWTVDWPVNDVQFVGPGCPSKDTLFRQDRLTVCFGVIKDGRRVIEDISIG